jgi:PAS domain S-box-containing protein
VGNEVGERPSIADVLREGEARYRATFDSVAIGVAHVAMDNRTIWVNRGLADMLGYTEAELLERSFIEVTHPEDVELDLAHAQRLLAGEIPSYRIEKRYLHKDGAIVWGDLAVSLVRDDEGQPRYAVGVVVDVTERKQAEARLEAVLAGINDHLVCYDRQWRYTYVNDKAAEILGKPKEELLGRSIWDLFPAAVGNQYYQELHTALAEQRVIRSEHYYPPFDSWFENHIYPTPDGVTVFASDVTWRKDLQRELQEHAQRLSESDRRKDEFLATLAHELRNPMAPLRNGLQLIRLAGSNPAMLEQARAMMERQVQQMVRLVDDLLDVSRINRNSLELRKEWVELASVIHAAVETSRPIIEEAEHVLEVSLPPEPLLLDADPVRVAQALANLLNNAAKYTERGGRIWLTVERERRHVVVRVRDSGIGIPVDQLPYIFDMFVQVDRSLERSRGGLGIGLTLVKRLIELHDGTVEARSAGPGTGSEFVVRLPLVSVAATMATGSGEGARAATSTRDAADSLTSMLTLLGHDVATAYEGLEAVALSDRIQPEIAFLDLGMPRLNGYDAARRIREQPGGKEMFLVALTGWGQDDDKRRSVEAGFDLHVVKPIDRATLDRLLRQAAGTPAT